MAKFTVVLVQIICSNPSFVAPRFPLVFRAIWRFWVVKSRLLGSGAAVNSPLFSGAKIPMSPVEVMLLQPSAEVTADMAGEMASGDGQPDVGSIRSPADFLKGT